MKTLNSTGRRLARVLIIAALSFAGFACASVKLADTADDAAAKTFAITPGQSNIYIFRSEDIVLNTGISITIDGVAMGDTGAETYILATVPPGKHSIVATGENTDTLEIDTEADRNYFVWLEIRLGAFTNHGHLHSVSEAVGRDGVLQSRLVN